MKQVETRVTTSRSQEEVSAFPTVQVAIEPHGFVKRLGGRG